ncbi:MAG: heme ABC transporter ATP-binding protein [Puniceicoccaceae bacterium]|nr:MAG: heme ABC transporter ATP-binding protein [Puniceicoccaceae bacterium]
MAATAAIQLRDVRFERRRTTILHPIDAILPAGRLTALLGPNGAGKSTLLKLCAGELQPSSGHIDCFGRALADWNSGDLARRRAVLPQQSGLRFPFRVEEVVSLGRSPHPGRGRSREDSRHIAAVLSRVGLAGFEHRLYTSLSGGEQQRVHLARALVQIAGGKPAQCLLLLDEPTNNLDLAHQHSILKLARGLRDEGVSVLAVLHDLNLALTYADDALLLHQGRLQASGPITEVLCPYWIQRCFGLPVRQIHLAGSARPHLIFEPVAPATDQPPSTSPVALANR